MPSLDLSLWSEAACRSLPTPNSIVAESSPVLRARTASGLEFDLAAKDEKRLELLEQVRSGATVDLELDIQAFSQFDGVHNENFVRFKKSKLSKLAKSFSGVPFLRDHDQDRIAARAGTVIASRSVPVDGGVVFEMTLRITAQWAVETVLAGNLDRFSIGWRPGGIDSIMCSECKSPIFDDCDHFPGDVLSNGHTVEFIFTEAEGIEVSGVNVPAVAGTGIKEIRAALSQAVMAKKQTIEDRHMKQFAQALGLKDDADEKTITAAIVAYKAKADQFEGQLAVSKARETKLEIELAESSSKLAELSKTRSAEKVDTLFADKASRFPVTRDDAGELMASPLETSLRALAANDYDAAADIVEGLPEAVVAASTSVRELQSDKSAPITTPTGTLDPVLASQLAQMKITEEEFALYNPVNGTARH